MLNLPVYNLQIDWRNIAEECSYSLHISKRIKNSIHKCSLIDAMTNDSGDCCNKDLLLEMPLRPTIRMQPRNYQ